MTEEFEVILSEGAEFELLEAYSYIAERSPENAENWLREAYREIMGLAEFHGYARARESEWLNRELQQKIFKSHRIVFEVSKQDRKITVHHFRHRAQRSVGEN